MMTSTNYTESKTLAAVKDWRTTDKAKIAAPAVAFPSLALVLKESQQQQQS